VLNKNKYKTNWGRRQQ